MVSSFWDEDEEEEAGDITTAYFLYGRQHTYKVRSIDCLREQSFMQVSKVIESPDTQLTNTCTCLRLHTQRLLMQS